MFGLLRGGRSTTARQVVCRRSFSSQNPFVVLGIPVGSSYDTVRRAFVQLALRHHPDRSKGGSSAHEFVRIRQAFEAIQEGSASSSPKGWSESEIQDWYRQETGEYLSFDMCEQTRREVVHAYRTLSQGGKDKGGYWEMARQLAEREDRGQDGPAETKLLKGDSSTSLGRRRKHR